MVGFLLAMSGAVDGGDDRRHQHEEVQFPLDAVAGLLQSLSDFGGRHFFGHRIAAGGGRGQEYERTQIQLPPQSHLSLR